MGLVVKKSIPVQGKKIKTVKVTDSLPKIIEEKKKVFVLTDQKKEIILDDILVFLAENPYATVAEISFNGNAIAKKRRVGKMVVAGVRASLTRGIYGDKGKLIKQKRSELRKLSIEASD